MENYTIKINDHKYKVKGLNINLEALVSNALAIDNRVEPEMLEDLLSKQLLDKLSDMASSDILIIAYGDYGYWTKHKLDPIDSIQGTKIIAQILTDLKTEIERQIKRPLKWYHEYDAMTKQRVKRYPDVKEVRQQLDDFEQSAKDGEIICLSDLMANSGM